MQQQQFVHPFQRANTTPRLLEAEVSEDLVIKERLLADT